MTDVITRFKLETTQYDSALRDASKSLAAYSKQAELAGKDFDKFTKGGVEAARALGSISTSATNTKDKVKELVSAYNDAARAYNNLTEEQKKSDFGKAMAQSLQQLQGRINDAKDEMNSTGGVLSQLRERFTVNIDALKLFSVGLQAARGALSVAKDAFFKNEEQLDTWGRVVEASQSLYSGFLDALNTGDISGYLTRIGEITKAAQDAYNALDDLNTFNAFNQVNVEKTRTGMTESIADYRSGQGKKEQVKSAGEAYQKELRERQKLEKQAYLESIKKVAAERGVNAQDLITALSGSYGSYQSLKAIPMSGTRTKFTPGGMFGGSTAYEEAYPVNRQEKLGAALRKFNDTELQSLQALGAQAERTGNEIAQVDKQLTRVLNGRQPGSGGGGKTTPEYIPLEGSIDAQTMKVQELQRAWRAAADDDSRRRIKEEIDEQQYALDLMTGKIKQRPKMEAVDVGVGIAPSSATDPFANINDNLRAVISPLQQLEDHLKELIKLQEEFGGMSESAWQIYQKEIENTKGQIDNFKNGGNDVTKGGKDIAKSWRTAASAINTVGSAMSGLKNPAIDIMTVIGQSIATIALSYAENLAGDKTTKGNIWAFIAAAAAATVSMATTIASIHSATGYAQGGEVKGNSYSGDNIPIMANAGEVVLTAAMTNNLANGIQNRGFGNMNIVGVLEGEKIKLVLNRHLKRTGQGELVTWR